MLRRKVYDTLMEWKENGNKPLLVSGQRQIGKTYIIEKFGKENFETYIYMNLSEDSEFRSVFEQDDRTVDNLILSIQIVCNIGKIDPAKTLLFLDEIQDCPKALSSLKSFKKDGRYKVIASGSMLGVTHNLFSDGVPPMGDARVVNMTSLDFEEFLWANNIPLEAIDSVKHHIKVKSEIEKPILNEFNKLFRIFQITGGMPAAVQAYVDDASTFANASQELEDIVTQIGRDITRYNDRYNAVRTSECFRSIPHQLAQTNKKFQYSRISPESIGAKNTRKAADRYMGNLLWIKYAGYGNFCYGLNKIQKPIEAYVKRDVFKCYLSDTGILTHIYGDMAVKALFTSDTSFNKGAITENAVAECLMKCGYKPRYFVNNNGEGRMEIDFLVEMFNGIVAIEVKSGKDRFAPSISKLCHNPEVDKIVILENDNIFIDEDNFEHYPLFASAFFGLLDDVPIYLQRR